MTAVERVAFILETPYEKRTFRAGKPAEEWHWDQLLTNGHGDGFYVRWTVGVVGRDIDEDTEWLEKALGRETIGSDSDAEPA